MASCRNRPQNGWWSLFWRVLPCRGRHLGAPLPHREHAAIASWWELSWKVDYVVSRASTRRLWENTVNPIVAV